MTTPQGLVADAAVIGICGRIGSGKDTVASMMGRKLIRWAGALRAIAVEVTGVPLSEWWSHADKQQRVELDPERVREAIRGCCLAGPRVEPLVDDHREFVGEKVAAFADAATAILTAEPELTRGRLLQLLGTECFRSLHDQYWILMMHWEWHGDGKIVIPDTRFENEAEFVKQYGVLIEVRRPGETSSQLMGGRKAAHASEPADGALRPQIIIWNDGTLEQLRDAVGLALRTTVADLRPENPLLVLSKPLATPIISSFGLQCESLPQ